MAGQLDTRWALVLKGWPSSALLHVQLDKACLVIDPTVPYPPSSS